MYSSPQVCGSCPVLALAENKPCDLLDKVSHNSLLQKLMEQDTLHWINKMVA